MTQPYTNPKAPSTGGAVGTHISAPTLPLPFIGPPQIPALAPLRFPPDPAPSPMGPAPGPRSDPRPGKPLEATAARHAGPAPTAPSRGECKPFSPIGRDSLLLPAPLLKAFAGIESFQRGKNPEVRFYDWQLAQRIGKSVESLGPYYRKLELAGYIHPLAKGKDGLRIFIVLQNPLGTDGRSYEPAVKRQPISAELPASPKYVPARQTSPDRNKTSSSLFPKATAPAELEPTTTFVPSEPGSDREAGPGNRPAAPPSDDLATAQACAANRAALPIADEAPAVAMTSSSDRAATEPPISDKAPAVAMTSSSDRAATAPPIVAKPTTDSSSERIPALTRPIGSSQSPAPAPIPARLANKRGPVDARWGNGAFDAMFRPVKGSIHPSLEKFMADNKVTYFSIMLWSIEYALRPPPGAGSRGHRCMVSFCRYID